MRIYRLERTASLHGEMNQVWDFFSSPANLNEITPDDLKFEILTDLEGVKMYPGMIINYKVRPVLNIPMRWTTEITQCQDKKMFVDEQRFGPYAFWHHKHFFEPQKDGSILMTDVVDYAIGWGFIGRIAHALFVKKKLEHIFDHRNKVIEKYFSKKKAQKVQPELV